MEKYGINEKFKSTLKYKAVTESWDWVQRNVSNDLVMKRNTILEIAILQFVTRFSP